MDYDQFLHRKSQLATGSGFAPIWMPEFLFDFQRELVEWSLMQGRAAMFADCGLGKTPMQLVWAENVVRKTGGRVLIIAPLAVAPQTIREGVKFGVKVTHSRDGSHADKGITITNYEQLHKFDRVAFAGVVCDESSAIKQFQGKRKKEVVRFMSHAPYRLMCTATAAPNDYIELGTHSEALGIMGQMDMLSTFFRSTDDLNHIFFKQGDFWNTHKWMLRAHAEDSFWRWVSSWARAIRKPSDYGYDDGDFVLPPMDVTQHIVEHDKLLDGEMFHKIAVSLKEQREERKKTIDERCKKVKELVDGDDIAVVWCHSNDEGDHLTRTIPGAVQIKGSDSDEHKERTLSEFAAGNIRVLVTKTSIAGFGMNWQHCNHMTFFPSHSFEQYYQGTRRCWRFGQKRTVKVDIVTTESEAGVTANLQRKAVQADEMFKKLVETMNDSRKLKKQEIATKKVEAPSWL